MKERGNGLEGGEEGESFAREERGETLGEGEGATGGLERDRRERRDTVENKGEEGSENREREVRGVGSRDRKERETEEE
eukprot:CAMPEP_0113704128 /NCGR_PEP_ID=MMETSP0038_2-20120614/26322_1 /TAXON_ID=2898 /ORGANISM="Cryptomonas paramecium" /LENGTH=78 /DNA_ID=CAMNT_0000628825 /DNA_START=725 /DNA_END=961 /DNA_ORIENTATION=+ /assembly_acc=CAM_ASM_000170